MEKLSVVMPVYNERETVREVIERVRASTRSQAIPLELIVVDDCSTDDSAALLEAYASDSDMIVLNHAVNQGKGAAIRTGIQRASGAIVLIQDADLEYDPSDYGKLIEPILSGRADVVYGSRFSGGEGHRVLYYWHSVGNRFLTMLSNMFTNINLTDMEVCYKAFRREIIESVNLEENRFGFEPEITAKVAKLKCRIYEVGISYSGRTYREGKKINWRDGFSALRCIVKYNLFR